VRSQVWLREEEMDVKQVFRLTFPLRGTDAAAGEPSPEAPQQPGELRREHHLRCVGRKAERASVDRQEMSVGNADLAEVIGSRFSNVDLDPSGLVLATVPRPACVIPSAW